VVFGSAGEERKIWFGLSQVSGLTPRKLWQLVEHLGSVRAVWEASPDSLIRGGLSPVVAQRVVARRSQGFPAVPEMENLGIRVTTWADPEYPDLLRKIPDPPPVLYVRGRLAPEDDVAVAIVGARKASTYGKMVAEALACELARCGVTVVSGLARGIDGAAHRGALRGGGRTIGVLGCGVDVAYPPEHRELIAEVARGGAVISELPCGTPPLAYHFPMRNRIISGLSLGVVVVEGGERSGALITADCALEQGREVLAVPGSILGEKRRAPHQLLKQGAKPVECVEDILEELHLPLSRPGRGEPVQVDPKEARVLSCLTYEPKHIDEIVEECGLGSHLVAGVLLGLEVRGIVCQLPGKRFARSPEPPDAGGTRRG